uniref:UspA domain-containing protein n=1 Tax=Kalanchoe fedtschenkoi TaxID=63787 RepID=A0A7N1A2F9_KALFE
MEAENHSSTAATAVEKPIMVLGIDESEHSYYALEWTLDHFFVPFPPNHNPFKLLILHSKPTAAFTAGLAGIGGVDILAHVEADLKKASARVAEKALEICGRKSVTDMDLQVVEGDPRNVLCEAVEKHHATMLVLGNHGHGAIKRAVLGSVSDYCAHHAHCSVLIVKRPKIKH